MSKEWLNAAYQDILTIEEIIDNDLLIVLPFIRNGGLFFVSRYVLHIPCSIKHIPLRPACR